MPVDLNSVTEGVSNDTYLLITGIVFVVIATIAGFLMKKTIDFQKDKEKALKAGKTVVDLCAAGAFSLATLSVFALGFLYTVSTNPSLFLYETVSERVSAEMQEVYGADTVSQLRLDRVAFGVLEDNVKSSYSLNENFIQDGLLGTVILEVDRNAMTGELVFYPQSGESKGTPVPTLK